MLSAPCRLSFRPDQTTTVSISQDSRELSSTQGSWPVYRWSAWKKLVMVEEEEDQTKLASIACISIVVEVNVLTYKDKNAKINNCRGH